ncbi:hypothetical protein AMTRI_Chr09g32330 [Amborella trichopoda]
MEKRLYSLKSPSFWMLFQNQSELSISIYTKSILKYRKSSESTFLWSLRSMTSSNMCCHVLGPCRPMSTCNTEVYMKCRGNVSSGTPWRSWNLPAIPYGGQQRLTLDFAGDI